jgi:hypothetical protein
VNQTAPNYPVKAASDLRKDSCLLMPYISYSSLPMALIKRDYVLKIYKISCAKIQHTVGLLYKKKKFHKTSLRHLGHVWPLKEMKGLKMREKRRSAPYSSWILCGACAEI